MSLALDEARTAAAEGEVPTGCVIVDREGSVVASAHNRTESACDASAHAEMIALREAFARNGNWRLQGHTLFVTKEPCPMCAGAIVLSRVDRVVWGVGDPKRGGGSVFGIFDHPGINHHPDVAKEVLEEPCREILREFFRKRREK
jgi:tRNA(adenine34) deaminase